MPLTPYQIKDDLLSNLDNSYNVVNTPGALAVVSKLESYTITTKDLQDTRLGRIINDMRKRTKSQELSKRAKNLLRQWQRLVPPDGEGGAPTTPQPAPLPTPVPSNGVHAAKQSKLQQLQQQNGKNAEGLVRPVSAAALLQRSESKSATPAVSRLVRPLSPAVSESSHKSGGRGRKRKEREDDRTPSSKRHAPSTLVDHISVSSPLVNGLHVSTSSPALSSMSRAKVKTTAELIAQLQRSSSNASVGSEVMRKLSSHQIERESAEPESILPPTFRKRQYHKKDSVTPALPESSPSQLHRTKKERLATFVQESLKAVTPRREGDEMDGASSNAALAAEDFMDGAPLTYGTFFPDSASIADSGPMASLHSEENSRLGPAEPPPVQAAPGSDHSTEPFADGDGEKEVAVALRLGVVTDGGGGEKAEGRSDSPAAEAEAGGEPAAFNVEDKILDVYAQLPPLGDPLSLTSETSYLASMAPHRAPATVSAQDVDQFHNTEWSGVNGCEGLRGAWSLWGEGASQETYDGEMLHFLPYVDLPSTDALPKYSWDDSIKDLFADA